MMRLGGVVLILALADSRLADGQVGRSAHMNAPRSVLTHHNDVERTGAYLYEKVLTPELVRASGLRLVRRFPLDATVGTQLLYLHQLKVNGRRRDLVYAVTDANTVHALDVRDGSVLWKETLRDQEDTARYLPRGPVSTPVIDPINHTMYIVYSTKNQATDHVLTNSEIEKSKLAHLDAEFWLVALDVRNGRKLRATKIAAGTRRPDGSLLTFIPENHWNRPALLLTHNSIYVAFGPRRREELVEYHGWVMRYDAQTLDQGGVFCTSAEARGGSDIAKVGQGAGIWQSGAGLAADRRGNVYLMTGNARADPARGWFGNSFIKLASGRDGGLVPAGWFSPEGPDRRLERYDWDLGSGGPLVIPGTSLVTGGGKTGTVYLIDAKTMRPRQSFQAARDMYAQTGDGTGSDTAWYAGPQLRGSLTFWKGPDRRFAYVYVWGARDYLRAYRLRWSKQLFDTIPVAVGRHLMSLGGSTGVIPGGMLSLSANGTSTHTGILWATLRVAPRAGYLLAAFDAETLDELWSTRLPAAAYLQPPTVASGMVMVATRSDDAKRIPEIRVYALDGAAGSQ